MSAKEFCMWVNLMKVRGYTERQLCALLGTGNNQIRRWKSYGAPVYIGYACAALVAGLATWPDSELRRPSGGRAA